MIRPALAAALALTPLAPAAPAARPVAPAHTAAVQGHDFVVDGKPFQILSASIHYERIPRADWPDRLAKLKAMGLNTVTTYVFWSAHEPTPGHFDFSGQNDIAAFIREAQRAGLFVLLRPGPYICAEWELGGYPSWLLKTPAVVLRSPDPRMTAATDRFFTELGKQIKPLLLQNGGPILATQVENEYGSFGDDHAYVERIHHMLLEHDLAAPILYTADGPTLIPKGGLPELPAVINFGTGEAKESFAQLATIRPDGPRMSGEYWAGWFDHWGHPHETRSAQQETDEITWMLNQGYSMNLYMGDGGTSFGWRNGANSNGTNYEPDTTSYDYDAPIAENGDLTPKYFAFQQAFRNAAHAPASTTAPDLAKTMPRAVYPVAPITQSASLWDNLPAPTHSPDVLTMEDLDQSYGDILYTTRVPNESYIFRLPGLHDYAQVYLENKLIGTLDRRLGTDTLTLPCSSNGFPRDTDTPTQTVCPPVKGSHRLRTLQILVENTGRVNYTAAIHNERKGLLQNPTLNGTPLHNWQIYSLPFTGPTDPAHFQYAARPCSGPCFFRTTMSVPPADESTFARGRQHRPDTYLDLSGNAKGFVWINDQPLGRFWSIGPQYSLWTPGAWLHPGDNTVLLYDMQATGAPHLSSALNWIAAPTVLVPAGQ